MEEIALLIIAITNLLDFTINEFINNNIIIIILKLVAKVQLKPLNDGKLLTMWEKEKNIRAKEGA